MAALELVLSILHGIEMLTYTICISSWDRYKSEARFWILIPLNALHATVSIWLSLSDEVTFSARLHLYLAFGFTWSRNQFKENFRHRKNYLV